MVVLEEEELVGEVVALFPFGNGLVAELVVLVVASVGDFGMASALFPFGIGFTVALVVLDVEFD